MNKYRNIIIAVIIIVAMLLLIGASYAFFTARIIGNEDAELMKLDSGTIELTFVDNNAINLSNAKPGDSESKTFTVENTGTFDDDYTYNIKLVDVNVTFLEEDLEYTLEEYTDDSYTDLKESGVNKTGFINSETLNENKEMYLAINIGRPEKSVIHYYKLTITFKELEGVNQNYNQGAIFNGKINVDDNKGAELYKKSYTITTNITNGNVEPPTMKVKEGEDSDTFTINPEEGYRIKSVTCDNGQQVEKTDNTFKVKSVTSDSECMITLINEPIPFSEIIKVDNVNIFEDNYENIRYAGPNEDVHNYIWFNCNSYEELTQETAKTQCEKWRIIGYMGDKNLVKIIRADSVGYISWDEDNKNNWTRPATLQTSFNNYYNGTALGSGKGITSTTKGMIEYVIWNIGGATGGTASQFYTAERGTVIPSGSSATWPGYIGLMYPSDYGYATTGSDDGSKDRAACLTTILGSYNNGCYEKDWLFGASEWLFTPNSSLTWSVFYVDATGYVTSGAAIGTGGWIRPTLYLKSNVKVFGGDGNPDGEGPYILTQE